MKVIEFVVSCLDNLRSRPIVKNPDLGTCKFAAVAKYNENQGIVGDSRLGLAPVAWLADFAGRVRQYTYPPTYSLHQHQTIALDYVATGIPLAELNRLLDPPG